MIKIDDKELKKYERDLKSFASRAYPYATRNTVNSAAFKAREIAQGNVRNDMTLRNRWTEKSIQVDKTKTLNVNKQAGVVGSVADYMETQEFGGVKTRGRGASVAIATAYSAGQEGQRPRTRLPRRPNRMQNIALQKKRKAGRSKRQQNFLAVKEAAQSGQKFVYLDLGKRKGIFRVLGGKRKPRIKMVQDLSRPTVAIPKNPWLSPAVKDTQVFIPQIYFDSLRFQLQRNNLFR